MVVLAPLQLNGQTVLMGLIGESISYTQSPAIHNFAARVLGKNIAYLPIALPSQQLSQFLEVAWTMGAIGFNVTKPHKETIARIFPNQGFPSVNTLRRGVTGWECASTDGEGFARGLEHVAQPLAFFEEIIFLGAGGATKAIFNHLLHLNADRLHQKVDVHGPPNISVTIMARQPEVASSEINQLIRIEKSRCTQGQTLDVIDLRFVPWNLDSLTKTLSGLSQKAICIQATSAPVHGDDLNELIPALKEYHGVFVDLVYSKPSALYFAAMAKDLVAQDGEAMLIEQARLAQEFWWGESLPYLEIKRLLSEMRKN